MGWWFVIAAAVLTCAGNLCLKYSRIQGDGFLSFVFCVGLAFFAVNVLVFSRALDHLPVSIAYPVFAGLGFIFVAVASRFLFAESLTAQQWVGMSLVLVGLGVMTNG